GIVYRTDARYAGHEVRVIEIPAELNVLAEYPIATVTRAPNAELARAWVTLVTSPAGQAALRDAGFGGSRKESPRPGPFLKTRSQTRSLRRSSHVDLTCTLGVLS